jgi:proteasome lid subunit RPN8/RPN11
LRESRVPALSRPRPRAHRGRLALAGSLVDRIRDHALSSYPRECCGFLIGSSTPSRYVTRAVPATNQAVRPDRFAIAPEEFLRLDEMIRGGSAEVLGFYHSHPDRPSAPSRGDLERAWPAYSYLIAGIRADGRCELRSWTVVERPRRFVEEDITSGGGER